MGLSKWGLNGGPGQTHRRRILQVGHDHRGYGQHEAGQNLLCVVVDLGIGEADAGTVKGHPGAPLELKAI